jgi:KUP system potassium uptake protein
LATVAFLCIDLAFLAANGLKIAHLGWLPLVVSAGIMVMMLIWLWGRDRLLARFMVDDLPIEYLLKDLPKGSIQRVPGMAVYLSGRSGQVPRALLHNLKHNKVIHEHTLLLHVLTLDEARSNPEERIRCEPLGEGLWEVSLRFGFFETPDVPGALQRFLPPEIPFKPGKISYFLGRETYRIGKGARLVDRVRLYLFALMARNASPANAYFNLPPGRVVELGAQVTI